MRFTEQAIVDLLDAWPLLRRAPSTEVGLVSVKGKLAFSWEPPDLVLIEDEYRVQINIKLGQDDEIPQVVGLDNRIPRSADHHVNPDGTFCLGSPLALRIKMGRSTNLVRFVEQCVVPFLYAASWREMGLPDWPFGELPHYQSGLVEDYRHLLQMGDPANIPQALAALGVRPRLANKLRCPCGCHRRLGNCPYRWHLASIRPLISRRYIRKLAASFRM